MGGTLFQPVQLYPRRAGQIRNHSRGAPMQHLAPRRDPERSKGHLTALVQDPYFTFSENTVRVDGCPAIGRASSPCHLFAAPLLNVVSARAVKEVTDENRSLQKQLQEKDKLLQKMQEGQWALEDSLAEVRQQHSKERQAFLF